MEGPARLRSSIACLRCRKSKIKCDNSGHLDAACENCIRSGHKCEWPEPVAPPSRRTEPAASAAGAAGAAARTDRDAGPERKRPRRAGDASQLDGQRYAEEILGAQFIDRDLWDKILVTYRRHFSTELPFLHIPTVKSRIFDLLRGRRPACPDFNLVLLGLLALTARFHPDLVKYVEHLPQDRLTTAAAAAQKPRGGRATRYEAVAASELFARALDTAMGSVMDAFTSASVERVQAWLMLGLHEWMSRNHGAGTGAWMYVGSAGRMAQALRLNCGDKSTSGEKRAGPRPRPRPTDDVVIEREVRRRTMFSCFILDRLMSCGRDRVSFLRSEDLLIQLPCTDEDFDLSRAVRTSFLNCDGPADFRATRNPNLLSRFIQLIDLWGDISKHSYAGGRFKDRAVPPWDGRSTFARLQGRLDSLEDSLEAPDAFLGFSASNYFRHDSGSSSYVLLHMLLAQCKIMLHREYIPFVPIRCEGPQGPIDEPTFPPEMVPPGYWEASARELFRASRNVVNLIELCGDKLPHSSLTAFVVWTVAFVGLYARAFPQMDVDKDMVDPEDVRRAGAAGDAAADSATVGPTKTTFDALSKLAQYSGVAAAYVAQFQEVDEFFVKIVADHHRNAERRKAGVGGGGGGGRGGEGGVGGGAVRTRQKLGVRHGGDTGGLEEWIKKGDRLTSNGFIIEDERPLPLMDGSDRSRGSTRERSLSTGPDASQVSTAGTSRGPRPASSLAPGGGGHQGSVAQSPALVMPETAAALADGPVEVSAGAGDDDAGIDWAAAPSMCLGTGFIGGDNIFGAFYDFAGQVPFDMWPAGPDVVDDISPVRFAPGEE